MVGNSTSSAAGQTYQTQAYNQAYTNNVDPKLTSQLLLVNHTAGTTTTSSQ